MDTPRLIDNVTPEAEEELTSVRRSKLLKLQRKRRAKVSLRSNYLIIEESEASKPLKLFNKVAPPASSSNGAKLVPSSVGSNATIINLHGAVAKYSKKGSKPGFLVQFVKQGKKERVDTVFLATASEAIARDWALRINAVSQQEPIRKDDFEQIFVLGKGHFGRVTLVSHKASGAVLALKELAEESVVHQVRKDKKKRSKSLSEMRLEKQISERVLLSKLGDNAFIARLAFAFREKGKLYLASEFSNRGDLWSMIRSVKRVGLESARFLTAQVVCAIESLHQHGIVHRDIKLENIMLDSFGRVKLIDLGLSKQLSKRPSSTLDNPRYGYTFSLCGTSYYQSPELISGVGHRLEVDWWQLGCLFFELIVGKPAFLDKTSKLVQEKILDISSLPGVWSAFSSSTQADESASDVESALQLLQALLVHQPADRLGFVNGAQDVKEHLFFQTVDWEAVKSRTDVAPAEIVAYVTVEGKAPNVVDKDVIARFFKDSMTIDGQRLNSSSPNGFSSSVLERTLILKSGSNCSHSKAFSSESVTLDESAEFVAPGKKSKKSLDKRRPSLPIAPEKDGPLLGFQFRAPDHILHQFNAACESY